MLGIVLDAWYQAGIAPVVYAREPEPPREVLIRVHIEWTEERIKSEVRLQAERYNVSFDQMWRTMLCENPELDPELQSYIVKDGVREDSWGLAQIHLPSHPKVRKEDAQNPLYAIEFMARDFSEGNAWKWTCWRNIFE